jgi:hypothetical protein
MAHPAALGLHDQVGVSDALVAQQAGRIANQKVRRIQHHQNFGQQGFHVRFA